jgi:hypothetical protein
MPLRLAHLLALTGVIVFPHLSLAQSAVVPKTNPMKVYAHYMPWFQTPTTLGANNWGYHWKMNTRNPNVIDGNGRRQIASNYYPLIGPYDSTDSDVIEYHMLLMKVAGIDGVIVDWYGKNGSNGDINSLLAASNKIISKVPNFGLKFAVDLEDRFATSVNDVKVNVDYAKQNYFTNPAYIRAGADNKPLLPVFGPIKYQTPSQWTTILSGPGETPAVMPLWYESSDVGTPAKGEYSWIYQDANQSNHLNHQQNFLANRSQAVGLAMGSAYPGFDDYYLQGGTGTNLNLHIPSNNGQTLSALLSLANQYAGNIDMMQLNTFNDFGEGTMFEPTVENGFSYLQQVQQYTGVPYGLSELQLVYQLYDARKQLTGNAAGIAILDTAANNINQLDFTSARTQIELALYRLHPQAGDATYDRKVTFDDLVVLAQHYDLATGQTWATGDFTADGAVTFPDLVLLAQNYGFGIVTIEGASAHFAADWALAQSFVPEPTTALLACGAIAFLGWRSPCRRENEMLAPAPRSNALEVDAPRINKRVLCSPPPCPTST